jgi:hypothetical protein
MPYLELKGQKLRCIEQMPAGWLLDMADASERGGMQVLASYRRFIYGAVLPEETERLDALLHDTENPVSIDDLNEALGNLMVAYNERPLAPASLSPAGGNLSEPMQRVVSLTPDMRREAPSTGEAVAS